MCIRDRGGTAGRALLGGLAPQRVVHRPLHGLQIHAEIAGQLPCVLRPLLPVLDLGDQGGGLAHRLDPALDRVQVEPRDGVAQREVDERLPAGDHVAHRQVATGQAQIAGVHVVRADRDERPPDETLVLLERPQRGLLPGRVPVEGVDDLAGEAVAVHQQPAQHADVVDAECRPARRHRGRLAGLVTGHHVGVALDDDRAAALGDLPLGVVDAVEDVRLLVDRRLGRVQVFRAVVVVEELARAEADHVAAQIPDRPQQPAAEPVDQRAGTGRLGEPGGDQLVRAEALQPQVLAERVPRVGGEAAPVLLRGVPAEAALGEELAGLPCARGAELVTVELDGRGVRGDQPLTLPGLRPRTGRLGAVVVIPQLDAGLAGQPLHRLDERQVLRVHQELDRVPALAAAMTEIHAPSWGNVERRGLLVVEGAQPLQVAAPGRAQRHGLADHVGNRGAVADQCDVLVLHPARHGIHPASRHPANASRVGASPVTKRRPGPGARPRPRGR